MSQQENSRIVREGFEAWNTHDVDRYIALLDDGYVEQTHTWPAPLCGREAARAAMREYFEAFPDLRFDIDVMISSQDRVFTRWLVSATGRGASLPTPGGRIESSGCTLSKLGNGKIVHVWRYWETDHMLRHVSARRGPDGALPVHRVPAASGAV
jgi:steroid delta-isomerase-like uncharacterized protein